MNRVNEKYSEQNMRIVGVDLFAGAGGLSLGAEMAGIDVQIAVENDVYAAETYKFNHPQTHVITDDIKNIDRISIDKGNNIIVLFGGPPCQGFSTSNQKTRNKDNPKNWLFKEFVRLSALLRPDWIVFENVRGIVETEKGYFVDLISSEIGKLGYTCSTMILCAFDYGIPQTRSRFFLIGSLSGKTVKKPKSTMDIVTVADAISDLPTLENGANIDVLYYRVKDTEKLSNYAKSLRGDLIQCSGHLVTKNASKIIQRYSYVPQGGNWSDIPDHLMDNYKDKNRCHTGIYKRLSADAPAITVGNYRKSMLIHPWENRGLSVREAARLQSFPDSYKFCGSIGFQQQQVGNAVPPYLAKIVFQAVIEAERGKK